MIRNEHGGFRCEGHDGILELVFGRACAMHSVSKHHEATLNHGHDDHGEELLTNAVGSFAMKFLDLEDNLFGSIVVFDGPAPEIEVDDLRCWKAGLVVQIAKKHGDRSIGADQPDNPQLDGFSLLSLSATESLQELVGRVDQNKPFLPAAGNEGLDGWKGRLRRTAEQKIPFVMLSEVGNKFIAGVSAVEEEHRSGGNEGQKRLGLLPLRSMDTDHTSGYRKASENIIGGCDETLGIVPFPFILETALRIKFSPDCFCSRKVVLGPIEGENRHPMPQKPGIARPDAVGQINRFSQDITEDSPWDLLASMGEAAAVDGFGIEPKSAAPCSFEELTRFNVYPSAFPAGAQGQNEGDQLWERQLTLAAKIPGGLS